MVGLGAAGYAADTEAIIEIGAIRLAVSADGAVTLGERFLTFADPGRPLTPPILRLTGIRDDDLRHAPSSDEAVALFVNFAFRDGPPCFVGHNVGFDVAFLERAGMPAGSETLDTAELASILLPSAASYALQRLAADTAIVPDAAHRALDDAITSALVLGHLARIARDLPALVLSEIAALSELLGPSTAEFFRDAAGIATRDAWSDDKAQRGGLLSERPLDGVSSRSHEGPSEEDSRAAADLSALSVETAFAPDGPLAKKLVGYEDRPEQRELAAAIERTFADGGALVAEAGTGVGKSLAYAIPALASASSGERVVISTHTLPLQDQLTRKDFPALQAALGSDVPIAVLKGRSNYLCPRRWQIFRGAVTTRDEARLLCKTLVWRTSTASGDRAELNLMTGEGELWSRISANDESCDQRRCKRTPGGCYLQQARDASVDAGIVVVNHALLLQDARMRGALLPEAEHLVIDEAHRLEDVATDAFGLELSEPHLRRDLQRVAHSVAVTSARRDRGHRLRGRAIELSGWRRGRARRAAERHGGAGGRACGDHARPARSTIERHRVARSRQRGGARPSCRADAPRRRAAPGGGRRAPLHGVHLGDARGRRIVRFRGRSLRR